MSRWLTVVGLISFLISGVALGASPTVVTLYGWGDQTTEALYRDFEGEFESDHPDIDLQVTILNYGDYFQKVPVMIATDTAPDVMEVEPENSVSYGKFIESGAFVDLMPYVRRDELNLDRFFEPIIESYMYQGTLPILPKKISSPDLVMYNQDLFDQAGVGAPAT
ncbi:MAG TPA: extracellular solute-binding protein, partial [Limnochordia bacterium]